MTLIINYLYKFGKELSMQEKEIIFNFIENFIASDHNVKIIKKEEELIVKFIYTLTRKPLSISYFTDKCKFSFKNQKKSTLLTAEFSILKRCITIFILFALPLWIIGNIFLGSIYIPLYLFFIL